jgi:hypothetical protein
MQCFMTGHYTPNKKWTNEVWGLAPLKDGDRFASCSDDGTLRIYSSRERKQIQMIRTDLSILYMCLCVFFLNFDHIENR